MKLDNTSHPVSQTATRVLFGCFIGFVVLAVEMSSENHVTRSTAFRVAAIALAFVSLCAMIAYFRPRGIPAFITSTAYVGVFVVAGIVLAGTELAHLSGVWAVVLAILSILGWTALGVYRAVAAHRDATNSDSSSN